jgi:hypothetical protein
VTPGIKILGVYSSTLSAATFSRIAQAHVDAGDPKNASPELRGFLIRMGREAELAPLGIDERDAMVRELASNLEDTALIEVLVCHADERFNVCDFHQAGPGVSGNAVHLPVAVRYLSEDGETELEEDGWSSTPNLPDTFRLAFYLHDWKEGVPLGSSYGAMAVPQLMPPPERLWRLTPYQLVD